MFSRTLYNRVEISVQSGSGWQEKLVVITQLCNTELSKNSKTYLTKKRVDLKWSTLRMCSVRPPF
jgi:hypothetical protein